MWFIDENSARKPLGVAKCLKTTMTLILQTVMEEPQRELSQTVLRCRDGKEASSKFKDNDSKDRSKEKDETRSSFASEKHSGGSNNAMWRDPELSVLQQTPHSDVRKESEWRTQTRGERKPPKEPGRHTRPPVKGVKCEGLLGAPQVHPRGTSSNATPARSSFTLRSIGTT